jgi:hypothetical protein
MTVIRTAEQPLTLHNRPEWCQIPRAGFFHMPKAGGEHDRHYHDSNELYLICRGRAMILNSLSSSADGGVRCAQETRVGGG